MYQIYFGFCVILSFFVGGFANKFYQEGDKITVECDTKLSAVITFWFQINSGAKHLFTVKGTEIKSNVVNSSKHEVNTKGKVSLTILSFEKKTDSGVYTCASMNSNKLIFGELTDIRGNRDPTEPQKQDPKAEITTPSITTKTCPKCAKHDLKPTINCETWILSSLASGCGVLLILLIFTILYCNRLRTRRCPHHYKRQPRSAGHAKLPNNHF